MDSMTARMRLLQFGDSMLPVGAFAFSNGVESAVERRVIRDRESLAQFVETALDQAANVDGVALIDAHRAAVANDIDRVLRADYALLTRKLNEESRTMTLRMGRKLAELSVHVAPRDPMREWLARIEQSRTPGTFPVGLAVVFAIEGLSDWEAFAAHQYGVATMMVSAALRLMKLSYLDAQSILYRAHATAATAYARAASKTIDDMAAFAPIADILAALHVHAHVRMFMS